MTNKNCFRQKFHLMPPKGWLNDPNGLCQIGGVYHVFFQYSPGFPSIQEKSWGHYESSDLVNWKFTGEAIKSDCKYDRDGAYSGSAIVKDNKIHIFYTGNVKHNGDFDYITAGREANTIHVTADENLCFGDKVIVMQNMDYPDCCTCHVRDPKVFQLDDAYYMVQGARIGKKTDENISGEDCGAILLFKAEDDDLNKWKYVKMITAKEPFGYMWECPDYFEVGNKKIISMSPQGVKREDFRFQNIYHSGYFDINNLLGDNGCLLSDAEKFNEWDFGFDFYAPQTFKDEKGRRILIGWVGLPDIDDEYSKPTMEEGWIHNLSMLREVYVNKNNRICQKPIDEYNLLCVDSEAYAVKENVNVMQTPSCKISIKPKDLSSDCSITIDGLEISYNTAEKYIAMEFVNDEIGFGRKIRRAKLEVLKKLDIYIDSSCVELYVNDGEVVMTTCIFPDYNKNNGEISIKTENLVGRIVPIKPINVEESYE